MGQTVDRAVSQFGTFGYYGEEATRAPHPFYHTDMPIDSKVDGE